MNQLVATLLDCPNLSLRVLDTNGRSIKTLNQEQLRQVFGDSISATACKSVPVNVTTPCASALQDLKI